MAAAATATKHRRGYGAVKQVTKTNFSSSLLQQIKSQIHQSDFVAISLQKTGDFSSSSYSSSFSWRRILPIDTMEIAYLKSKVAAEKFQLLQFAVCPFSVRGSKVHAFPYNFHLFPRDELNIGMPSYSFSCQTSYLTSMARDGFDFNACINDGISYLSRVQEAKAKERNPVPRVRPIPSSNPTVADSLFMGRIKSRVEHWRDACKNKDKIDDSVLVSSLRKLILGDELYGSRPCTSIDVCSDRQVQLALEIINQIGDDLVPLVIPDKEGGPKAVRVVLTSSDEDKNLLMSEIENLEEEQNLKVRGFREVIDLVSSSHKPIIAYNCLHDFTFIHSKFLAPLPPSLYEFMCSLRLVFPSVLDISHLSGEVGPLRKAKNLSATMSYLKRQFFLPIELEIPQQADDEQTETNHGHNVLRMASVFAKLHNLLKLAPNCQNTSEEQYKSIEDYANIFHPTCTRLQEPEDDEDVNIKLDHNRKKVSTENLVFLWGFDDGVAAFELKHRLQKTHCVFSEDFELQLVDKTCSVFVFKNKDDADLLLEAMRLGEISDGLKGAGYELYEKVCKLGLWESDLANSLEAALSESDSESKNASDIYWNSELMIDLDNL